MDPSPVSAYEGLAPIYDYVMRHVDYQTWTDYIHQLLAPGQAEALRLADLACGTGNTTALFEDLGYQVVGIDGSAAMVDIARQKAAERGSDTHFYHCDLRQLHGVPPCAAAVCLYDSFNYLLTPEDFAQAIANVDQLLLPDSTFVFDVCAGRKNRGHSEYDAEERLQYNHFRLRFDGCEEEFAETHTQRIYPLEQVIALAEASPFELVDYFDDFTFERATEESDRVHFVLRR